MSTNNWMALKQSKNTIWGIISLATALVLSILVLNFFLQIIKTPKLQGMPLLISPLMSLIGIILGFIGFRRNKNLLSLVGIIFNFLLFIFPFVFWYIGYIVEGV